MITSFGPVSVWNISPSLVNVLKLNSIEVLKQTKYYTTFKNNKKKVYSCIKKHFIC